MKTVFTYGVFDLLHLGHIQMLKEAKGYGDKLIVGLFTDEIARSFKREPIIPSHERFEMIAALRAVDAVMFLDDLSPELMIQSLKPDIVIKGPGAGYEDLLAQFDIKFPEIRFILAAYHDGQSTSQIINKIQNENRI